VVGKETILHLHAALAECHELERLDDFKKFIQTRIRQILPHRMAVCGLVEFRSRRVLRLINIDFPTGYLQRVIRPDQVTLAFPLKDWICKRCPMVILTDQADSPSSPWNSAAREYGIRSIAYYGIADVSGTVSSYFAFGELDQWTAEAYTGLLNLIVPHLHAALVKILTTEHLVQAIGSEAADIEAASSQPSDLPARDPARFNITERERQVLRWMAAGKSNWEIGAILRISEFTAKNHVQSVLKKLSVSSRAQAVAKAVSCGLVAADAAPERDDLGDLFSTGSRGASGAERPRKTI
jgi:transcriptional regulator EpsA